MACVIPLDIGGIFITSRMLIPLKMFNSNQTNTTNNNNYTSLHSAQSHHVLRKWQSKSSTTHEPANFILPIFVIASPDETQDIPSMPGVKRFGINSLVKYLTPLVTELGLKSVLLFPVLGGSSISQKESNGNHQPPADSLMGLDAAVSPDSNPVLKTLPLLRTNFPDLLLVTDVCLCAFTETGHCCVFRGDGVMDNDASLEHLVNISLAYAKAGAHVIAPSDMMDGRIGAIRRALNQNHLRHISILSYAAKFSSCFYGPFRDAAFSAPKFGDRKNYQLPPGSSALAKRAVIRDIQEGADCVMVKPGLPYLDIVKDISLAHPEVPIAVYHVSGEYAMLVHGAKAGAFDLQTAASEVLVSFRRAGASIIITYLTPQILEWMKNGQL